MNKIQLPRPTIIYIFVLLIILTLTIFYVVPPFFPPASITPTPTWTPTIVIPDPITFTPTETPTARPSIPVINCLNPFPGDDCAWPEHIRYVPLSTLDHEDCTEAIHSSDERQCQVFTYPKEKSEQSFTIQVEGGSPAIFEQYVKDAKVYFIVMQVEDPKSLIPITPSLTSTIVTQSPTLTKTVTPSLTPPIITPSYTPTETGSSSLTPTIITPSPTGTETVTPSLTPPIITPSTTPTETVTPSPIPTVSALPSLAAILVESMMDVTGRSREELRAMLLKGKENPTTREVLSRVTGNNSLAIRIRKRAINRAQAAYQAAGLDSSGVPAAIDSLLNQPLATVYAGAEKNGGLVEIDALLYQNRPLLLAGGVYGGEPVTIDALLSGQLSTSYPNLEDIPDSEYQTLKASLMASDPEFLVVTMDWSSAPEENTENEYVVWYSIDPEVFSGKKVEYKEKCNTTSASVGIQAIRGSMTVTLLQGFQRVSSGTANIEIPGSSRAGPFKGGPSNKVNFDAFVVGVTGNPGKYTISGGWKPGVGCK